MADDLKPCPFCGGEAYLSDDASHSRAYFIGCNVDDCFGEIHWEQTKAEAIANWNRRAIPAVQGAAKVLLACHTVQTMIAAGKPLDLAVTLRAIAGDSHD